MKINFNRLKEVHGQLEKARLRLASLTPPASVDPTGSYVLPEFRKKVEELMGLIAAYNSRLEEDSRALYQTAVEYAHLDSRAAREYVEKIGAGLSGASAVSRPDEH